MEVRRRGGAAAGRSVASEADRDPVFSSFSGVAGAATAAAAAALASAAEAAPTTRDRPVHARMSLDRSTKLTSRVTWTGSTHSCA